MSFVWASTSVPALRAGVTARIVCLHVRKTLMHVRSSYSRYCSFAALLAWVIVLGASCGETLQVFLLPLECRTSLEVHDARCASSHVALYNE